jgi:hypothetical protein
VQRKGQCGQGSGTQIVPKSCHLQGQASSVFLLVIGAHRWAKSELFEAVLQVVCHYFANRAESGFRRYLQARPADGTGIATSHFAIAV